VEFNEPNFADAVMCSSETGPNRKLQKINKSKSSHGRRKGGQGRVWPPWILKISAKKVVFVVSNGKKQMLSLWVAP